MNNPGLHEVLARWRDGDDAPGDESALIRALRAHPNRLAEIADDLRFENALAAAMTDDRGDTTWQRTQALITQPSDSSVALAVVKATRPATRPAARPVWSRTWPALAAAALLCIGLAMGWHLLAGKKPLAEVLSSSNASVVAGQRIPPGHEIHAGDSGQVRLRFDAGLTVDLTGPGRLRLGESPLDIFHCSEGRLDLSGDAGHGPLGFSTAQLHVRLTGTRLDVDCRSDRTRLTVGEGSVQVLLRADGSRRDLAAGSILDTSWSEPVPEPEDGLGRRRFPQDVGVIDLGAPPYTLDPTGARDAAPALMQALADHAGQDRILFLPGGRYRLSGPVTWPEGRLPGPRLQGEGREVTVLRLDPRAAGFDNPQQPRHLIDLGIDAATIHRSLVGLRLVVGAGNPGAIALRFRAHYQGLLADVDIVSEDGQGVVGLDLAEGELGPCLVQRVRVEGFAVGIRCDALNGVVLNRIDLSGQSRYGLHLSGWGNPAMIEGLRSRNRVPAIANGDGPDQTGHLTLIDADCSGGDPHQAAIITTGILYACDLRSHGYGQLVATPDGRALVAAGTAREFCSHPPLTALATSSAQTGLGLPAIDAPRVAWPTSDCWLDWRSKRREGVTDADCMQATIDDADHQRPAVLVARAESWEDGCASEGATLILRGGLARLQGSPGMLHGPVSLVTGPGSTPALAIELLRGDDGGLDIIHRDSRPLIIRSTSARRIVNEGPGPLFLEEVACEELISSHPQARTWVRMLNSNRGITVDAGEVRVLGWRFEGPAGTRLHARGGRTDILGCLFYCSGPQDVPIFAIDDAAVSLGAFREVSFAEENQVRIHIRERQGAATGLIGPDQTVSRQWSLYRSARP